MPFHQMSDDDVLAIISFLRQQAPVRNGCIETDKPPVDSGTGGTLTDQHIGSSLALIVHQPVACRDNLYDRFGYALRQIAKLIAELQQGRLLILRLRLRVLCWTANKTEKRLTIAFTLLEFIVPPWLGDTRCEKASCEDSYLSN
jgi:hypothetical protein